MAWFEGTATDYQDLLDLIKEYATSDNIAAVSAIDNGGTGFSEGDLVTVSGGTSTTDAVLEVVAVSGGVVTEIRVYNGGAYSVLPSTTQTSLTSSGGSGLDVTLTTQPAGWVARVDRSVFRPISVAVNAGGSGYNTLSTATLDDGAATELRPTIVDIDSVSGGVVTGVSFAQRGIYESIPGSTGQATVAGAGTGLTLDLTWQEEKELILEGSGSGSDEIFVGIRTFSDFVSSPYFNFELAGFSGFNSGQWSDQPDISRGRYDDDSNIGGIFVPLRNVSMQYWMSITSNRIMFWVSVGTNIASGFLGFIDPTSSPGLASGLYAYPLLIAGSSTDADLEATSATLSSWSGFHDPVAIGQSNSGARSEYSCCQLWSPAGGWLDFRNAVTASSSDGGTNRVPATDRTIHPLGSQTSLVSGANGWPVASGTVDPSRFTTQSFSAPVANLVPTPDSGGDKFLLVPLTMISYFSPAFIAGQIPDLFWMSAEAGLSDNGSVINYDGDRYRLFQSGRYSDPSQFVAVKEA